MRRFRVPTIPNMGIFISRREGEPFQTCDSAIFADAEEESPRPEERPSVPHFTGLRRRNTNHEESRFMDATQDENRTEKRPSATTRFKTLKSISTSEDAHATDFKENNEPQVTRGQHFAGAAHDSESSPENGNKFFQDSQVISTCDVADPLLDAQTQRDNSCQETILCQSDQRQTEEMDNASQTGNASSNVVTRTFTPSAQVRRIEVVKPFRKVAEHIRTLNRHLSQHTIPRLHKNTSVGFSIVVTNLALVFNFLRCCFGHLFHLFAAIKAERVRTATETKETQLPASISEESSSDTNGDILSRATDAEKDVGGQPGSVKTDVPTDVSAMGIDPLPVKGEKLSSAHSSQKSTRSNPEQPLYPPAPIRGKNLGDLTSDMTEQMMTAVPNIDAVPNISAVPNINAVPDTTAVPDTAAVPGTTDVVDATDVPDTTDVSNIPPFDRSSDNLLEEDKTLDKSDKTSTQQHPERKNSARKIESQGIPNCGLQSRSSAENDAFEQGRNSPEDLLNELDQSSMRFEHKASEIIISPLNPTSPVFFSDGEFDTENRRRMKYPGGEVPGPEKPVRLSTEIRQTGRSGKKRNSRGPTGKLRTDVRTMKDTIIRAFGRNKAEPETRFASPRSARKTLALIADMLVKEHGCDVAVRRNGALKMRCEKIFTGSQRLKVRLAFQPMDAYSCNVIICRSREDEYQVSTTDYVGFVADVQRSFLNATSEAMLGTDVDI